MSRIDRKDPEPKRRLQRQEKIVRRKSFEVQESRMEQAIPGGRKTPGSGNGWAPSKKGDVTGDIWRAEGKTRAKDGARSITIKLDDIEQIEHLARTNRQIPVFVFGFDGNDQAAFRIDDAQTIMHIVTLVRRGDYDEASRLAENLL